MTASRRRGLQHRLDAARAPLTAHLTALPPGFEDRCVCLGCEMGRALYGNLNSLLPSNVVEREGS